MITDPWFYAIAVPTLMLVGFSKSGFLGGIAVLGVPMLSLAVSPLQAAGIVLPILLAMDAVGIWAYRHHYDVKNILFLLPSALFGIFIGWLLAAYIDEAAIRLLVGLIALLFTLDHWFKLRPHVDEANSPGPHFLKGSIAGLISGFTSFVSHTGSPPIQIYLLPQRLAPMIYAGTMAYYFAVINSVKVVPYFLLGQFSAQNLTTSLVLLPIAPISMLAGLWLIKHVPQKPFYLIAYSCLFIVSLKLIWDGISILFL